MKKKVVSIIDRAKEGLIAKRQNHDPSWPPHNLFCSCRKCMSHELNYIKDMKKEHRKAKAKQKASK